VIRDRCGRGKWGSSSVRSSATDLGDRDGEVNHSISRPTLLPVVPGKAVSRIRSRAAAVVREGVGDGTG
jgi:hypothetical protein